MWRKSCVQANQDCIQSDSLQPCTMFNWSPKHCQKWKSPAPILLKVKVSFLPPCIKFNWSLSHFKWKSKVSPSHPAKSSTGPKILSKVKVIPSRLALFLLQLPRVSFNQVSINPSLTSHTIDPLNFLESDQDFYFYICLFPFFFIFINPRYLYRNAYVQIYVVCLSKSYWPAVDIWRSRTF